MIELKFENGQKKAKMTGWTEDEDHRLIALVNNNSKHSWTKIAESLIIEIVNSVGNVTPIIYELLTEIEKYYIRDTH